MLIKKKTKTRKAHNDNNYLLNLGIIGIVFAGIISLAKLINVIVPDPYLDEIFHIPQAQRYCDGIWSDWDDKITTGPGLYLYSVGMIRGLFRLIPENQLKSIFTSIPMCHVEAIRMTNVLLWPFFVMSLKLASSNLSLWESIVVSLFPLNFFFYFLYYTDTLSITLLMASVAASKFKCWWTGAIFVTASILTRQTNYVWGMAITLGVALIEHLKGKPDIFNPALRDSSPAKAAKAIGSLIILALRDLDETLHLVGPYILITVGFGTFVVANGGSLVLGDKSNHTTALHIPQVLYFFAFATIWSAPLIVTDLDRWKRISQWPTKSPIRFVLTIVIMGAFELAVHYFTYEHPFLLADNRHYVFYIWQRTYRRYPIIKYILVPAYMVASGLVIDAFSMAGKRDVLTCIAYFAALCVTLISSPLIEPRYFIIPYILYRINLPKQPRSKVIQEFLIYLFMNGVTIYIFLQRPFKWDGVPGWMRFMW